VPGPGGRVRSTPTAAATSAASPAATPAYPASPAAPLCLRVFFLLICESSSFLSARGSCAPGGRTPRMPAPLRALPRRLHAPAGPAPAVTLRYSASLSDSAHPEFWRPRTFVFGSCSRACTQAPALVALELVRGPGVPPAAEPLRRRSFVTLPWWPRRGGREPRWPHPAANPV
jgi:hypothetical protein